MGGSEQPNREKGLGSAVISSHSSCGSAVRPFSLLKHFHRFSAPWCDTFIRSLRSQFTSAQHSVDATRRIPALDRADGSASARFRWADVTTEASPVDKMEQGETKCTGSTNGLNNRQRRKLQRLHGNKGFNSCPVLGSPRPGRATGSNHPTAVVLFRVRTSSTYSYNRSDVSSTAAAPNGRFPQFVQSLVSSGGREDASGNVTVLQATRTPVKREDQPRVYTCTVPADGGGSAQIDLVGA